MSRTLPNPGTHPAKTSAAMVVSVASTGSLCVQIPTVLEDGTWSGKGTVVLVKADGTPMSKNQQSMRDIFGWQSENPFDLEEIEVGQHPFDIVGIHEAYTPNPTDDNPNPVEQVGFKIQWFNAPGRSGGANMPERLDEKTRREVLTKFSNKFKVGGGGSPAPAPKKEATPEKETQPEPPARRSAAPTPPSRKSPAGIPRTSSQQEVWTAYKNLASNANKSQNDVANVYYDKQDEVRPNANGNMTPEEWGKVADLLGV